MNTNQQIARQLQESADRLVIIADGLNATACQDCSESAFEITSLTHQLKTKQDEFVKVKAESEHALKALTISKATLAISEDKLTHVSTLLAESQGKLTVAWADLRKARQRIEKLELEENRLREAYWIESWVTMRKVMKPGDGDFGFKDAIEWIKQSARLREVFNQGLAIAAAK